MNEILIYDVVGQDFFGGGITARDIKAQLDSMGDVEDITVRINSPGGDVFDGLAIFNLLSEHPAKISVKVDGYAASIASIIAMAGDSIDVAQNAMFMIHNPWTFAAGDAGEMRKQADVLDKVKDSLIGTYQTRVGFDEGELSALMDSETWYSADEAVKFGFADTVTGKGKLQNIAGCRWINKAPKVEDRTPTPTDEHFDLLARSVELAAIRADIAQMRNKLQSLHP